MPMPTDTTDTNNEPDTGEGEGSQTAQAGDGQQQERELSPREQAMNAIVVKREEEPPAPAASAAQQAAEQAALQQAAQDPGAQHQDVDQVALQSGGTQGQPQDLSKLMVKVKIDGQEREVSVADMQRQYQINGAAEVRLQQATRLLNEARARAAAAPPVGSDARQGNGDSAAAPENQPTAKEIVQALFTGSEEEATQAVQKLLAGRSTPVAPTHDPEQLVEQLAPVLKQQLVVESALDKFMAANADIVQDPHLVDLTNRFLEAEVAGGKPYPEALQAAGEQTRGWLARMGVKPAAEPAPTTPRDKKLERKAAMDNLPALNQTAASTQEPPQSASDVIAQMRKARGLPD